MDAKQTASKRTLIPLDFHFVEPVTAAFAVVATGSRTSKHQNIVDT